MPCIDCLRSLMLTQAVLEEQCPLFTLSHWMNDNHINHIDLLKVIMACAVQC